LREYSNETSLNLMATSFSDIVLGKIIIKNPLGIQVCSLYYILKKRKRRFF